MGSNWFMGYFAFYRNQHVLSGNVYGQFDPRKGGISGIDIPMIEKQELVKLQSKGKQIDNLVAISFSVF